MSLDIQKCLEQMEAKYADSIQQIKCDENSIELKKWLDDSSNKQILIDSEYSETNIDIRWQSNAISEFFDENIPNLYRNDPYSKATRWDLYLSIIETMKEYKISNNIDIGAANNHFSFLAKKANIDSYGIEPRKSILFSCDEVFRNNFGKNNRFGFVGSLKTFSDFILNQENKIEVDCITVLNFLHGGMHIPNEIERFFLAMSKIAKYAVFSEPNWSELNLAGTPENFIKLKTFDCTSQYNVHPHFLYKLCR